MNKLIILFTLFLFSCNSSKKVYNNIDFENIYQSEIGGKVDSGFEILHSNEEYLALIERLKLNDLEDEKLLEPNFEVNDVLVTYLGQKNSGGYSIEIESLYWKDSILFVNTNVLKPGKGEVVDMKLTQPYCISLIPKTKTIIIE